MGDERKPVSFATEADMPERVMSLASMLWNRTGTWRYLRPRYADKVPACNEACPAGNDIERFVRLIEQGDVRGAWQVLKEENPLPRVTGRVCFHPCESGCNRKEFDAATSIQALERYAADQADPSFTIGPLRGPSGKRVVVVGSGPAGLTAAYHLARMGHAVTVLDDGDEPGGVLRVGIPEYRLPKKVLDLEIADIKGLGVGFGMKTALGRDVTLDGLRAEYDAVFLATGAHKSRRLGVPGEDLPGVVTGLSLLRRINAGERMDVGRRVLVVGGGNTAIDAARSAARLGAAVRVLYRRSRAEMPAHEVEIEEATREGVELRMLCAPVEVIAKDGRAAGLKCTQMRLGKPDASGRRAPEPIPGSEFVLEADTVVTAIGESADFSWAVPGLDAGGDDLVLDAWGRTTLVGVFAGGDAADVSHTVVDAIGAGKRAAIGIDRFLAGEPVDGLLPAIGERRGVSIGRYLGREVAHRQGDAGKVVRYADLNPAYFHETARGAMQRLAPAERRSGFDEVNLGLAPQEALAEARRCLHCGVCNACDNCYLFCPDVAIAHRADAAGYALDLDYCKGCGICVHECPRCAMLMEEDQ